MVALPLIWLRTCSKKKAEKEDEKRRDICMIIYEGSFVRPSSSAVSRSVLTMYNERSAWPAYYVSKGRYPWRKNRINWFTFVRPNPNFWVVLFQFGLKTFLVLLYVIAVSDGPFCLSLQKKCITRVSSSSTSVAKKSSNQLRHQHHPVL